MRERERPRKFKLCCLVLNVVRVVITCVKLARGVLGLAYIGETASLGCRGLNQLLLSLCVFLSACCRGLCKRRRI